MTSVPVPVAVSVVVVTEHRTLALAVVSTHAGTQPLETVAVPVPATSVMVPLDRVADAFKNRFPAPSNVINSTPVAAVLSLHLVWNDPAATLSVLLCA